MPIPINQGSAGGDGRLERPIRPSGVEIEKTPEAEPRLDQSAVERAKTASAEQAPVAPPPVAMPIAAVQPDDTRDPLLLEIEQKLEEGLGDVYRQMPQDARVRFKAEGERLAHILRDAIATGKLVANKVLKLIVHWLKMVPGVNRWFLMQEAKIKTDALLELARERGGVTE